MTSKIDHIEELLIKKLDPTRLIIDDKTALHSKHPGHVAGKFHLKIEIESPFFSDKSKIEQHRLVFDILEPYLKEDIHSVSLNTYSSDN